MTEINERNSQRGDAVRLNECARQSNTISLDYLVSSCDLDTRDPNALTVLRSFGPRITKFIRANGEIVSNDEARNHTASVVSVATQEQLIALLKVLERRPDCEIVCGAIVETANRWRMRRLKNDDPKTGDKATLEDVPRHVFPLDVDSVATPVGLDPHDLETAATAVRSALPKAFDGVACVAVATSGYLLKPDLRFRCWFRFDRALTCAELKRWMQREKAPIDLAPLHAAGVAYTAAPVFEDPGADPLPDGRLVVLDGGACVSAPSMEELRAEEYSRPSLAPRYSSGGGMSALLASSIRIRNAGIGDRHKAILHESLRLASLSATGRLDEDLALRSLLDDAAAVGKADSEVTRIFEWSKQAVASSNLSSLRERRAHDVESGKNLSS